MNNMSMPYSCSVCDVHCDTELDLQRHTDGRRHQHRVTSAKSRFFCDVCAVDCFNQSTFEVHVNGKKHSKKTRQQQNSADSRLETEVNNSNENNMRFDQLTEHVNIPSPQPFGGAEPLSSTIESMGRGSGAQTRKRRNQYEEQISKKSKTRDRVYTMVGAIHGGGQIQCMQPVGGRISSIPVVARSSNVSNRRSHIVAGRSTVSNSGQTERSGSAVASGGGQPVVNNNITEHKLYVFAVPPQFAQRAYIVARFTLQAGETGGYGMVTPTAVNVVPGLREYACIGHHFVVVYYTAAQADTAQALRNNMEWDVASIETIMCERSLQAAAVRMQAERNRQQQLVGERD